MRIVFYYFSVSIKMLALAYNVMSRVGLTVMKGDCRINAVSRKIEINLGL